MRGKLIALTLVLLACVGCDARDGMVLKDDPAAVQPEENRRGLVNGMEDMLDGVERTARDIGRQAERTMK